MNINMWILVFFDLPTETKKDKKVYVETFATFCSEMGSSCFTSIYLRHCASMENAEAYIKRVKTLAPWHMQGWCFEGMNR